MTTREDLSNIRERIEGKRVVAVESNGDKLVLDDGTVLWLYLSDSDCCAYAYGDWVIQADALDAIITDVKIDVTEDTDDYDVENRARITILHNQNPVALADCVAGHNGYYFSVLSLNVLVPGSEGIDTKVVSA